MPWGSMGTIWAEMGLDNTKLIVGIEDSMHRVDQFDQSITRRFKAIGDNISQIGKEWSLGITAPLSVFGGMAAKASAGFESAMANVWTIAEVTREELDAIGDRMEDLSRRIPQSATQLAEGLYDAIGSGITNIDDAMRALEISAKAGMAGASDTATAMDALTSVLNAYGKSVDEAQNVTDIMFRTVDRGKIMFGELANELGQVVSTAATAKVPFEEVSAAFATLTKGGIGAAEASTAVNQAILSIIQPSKEAADYAKRLGIEFNAAALESKGFAGVLEDVYKATGGNIEALTTLFPNVRALKGVLGLVRNEMRDYAGDMKAMAEATGATEAAFQKQMQTSAAQAKLFKNELAVLVRSLGDELWPELLRGQDILKPFVQMFVDLPEPIKQSAVQFGLLAAAVGPALLILGKLVTILSGPAGLVLAVGAAVFGIKALIQTSQDLEGQIERQVRQARKEIDSALESARAHKDEADKLDQLIKKYDELRTEVGENYEEHEELREVIDRIVQLCPEAATGYDEMGRALMDNADRAKRYRDELYKLHEQELELAASRAKYELPELRRQAEWLQPDLDRARQQLDALAPLYEKASEFWYKIHELNREMDEAIDRRDVAAQEAIERERQLLLQEAVNAGIITTTADQFGRRINEIREQYNKARDTYVGLLDVQRTIIRGIIELQGKQEELEEFRTGRKPGETGTTTTAGTTTTTGVGAGQIDEFEALGKRIKELSGETYQDLREAWERIEEGLNSDDMVAQIYAEDQLGKLTRYLRKKIFEFGGDFAQAAAATAQYIRNGWKEINEILDEEMNALRNRVSLEGLGTEEQIAELERLRDAYAETGADLTQIDIQLASLREQQRKEEVQGAIELYRFYAQLYDYDAQNHIDHINRLLLTANLSTEERKELEQELQLWKKRLREEEVQAETQKYRFLRELGALTYEEIIAYELKLTELNDDKLGAASNFYRVLSQLIRGAKEEELLAIRETLVAELLKYEAMGQGASAAALAIRAAIADIDRMISEGDWAREIGGIETIIKGMASSLRQAEDGWSSFFATILENIRFVKVEGQDIIDWAETLAQTMAGIETVGLAGIGQSLGRVVSGRATPGDIAGLAGAGIGYAIGGPAGAAIGQLIGGLVDFFTAKKPPSAEIETQLDRLAKEFEEFEKGGEVYYKSGWDKFWSIKSRDIKKTFYDIAEALGTTTDDIASSLASAFQEDTYEDFVKKFTTSLEQQTVQALISAFMAGEVMKPLLDNLSRTITEAVMDAELTDEERAKLRKQIADLADAAEPFYEMLRELFPDLYGEKAAGVGKGDVSRRPGAQISEITGPTRDLLIEIMRPITVLDSLPVYFMSMERAIYEMRDAFLEYARMETVIRTGEAAVVNEYHIQQIVINAKDKETFDSLMESLDKRAEIAVLGSGVR